MSTFTVHILSTLVIKYATGFEKFIQLGCFLTIIKIYKLVLQRNKKNYKIVNTNDKGLLRLKVERPLTYGPNLLDQTL